MESSKEVPELSEVGSEISELPEMSEGSGVPDASSAELGEAVTDSDVALVEEGESALSRLLPVDIAALLLSDMAVWKQDSARYVHVRFSGPLAKLPCFVCHILADLEPKPTPHAHPLQTLGKEMAMIQVSFLQGILLRLK